jgi:putative heme-binding domain-containing protein
LVLAKHGRAEDRERLIEALGSMQPGVVRAAAVALVNLSKKNATPIEIGKAVRALRGLAVRKSDVPTQQAVVKLISSWSGHKIEVKGPPDVPWVHWYMNRYPKEAALLPGLSGSNLASWKKRSAKIDWSAGDASRGELVFQRKNCFQCHGGDRRFGPDLRGAAQRFSRDDLLAAIIDPNKDISPAYRPTMIVTTSGKVHSGMVIYESPALTLLQTTPDTTVRVPQDELSLMQPGNTSFMPAGLLDDASDSDLADLYAYLMSLKKN